MFLAPSPPRSPTRIFEGAIPGSSLRRSSFRPPVCLVCLVSGVVLGAWRHKKALEQREGSLNGPKALLIGVTVFFSFLVPGNAGPSRLELAFQSMNAWRSFQYLGLVWLINTMRL